MTSQLPRFQCFFAVGSWEKGTENGAAVTSLMSFLFCDYFTGSTIRFWHKVKTWLDQMFWQMYQKLRFSGFLSSGNLCLIHHLKFFLTSLGLNSLCQKECHVLVKNCIFSDPFQWPVLVILVPVMIRSSGS